MDANIIRVFMGLVSCSHIPSFHATRLLLISRMESLGEGGGHMPPPTTHFFMPSQVG